MNTQHAPGHSAITRCLDHLTDLQHIVDEFPKTTATEKLTFHLCFTRFILESLPLAKGRAERRELFDMFTRNYAELKRIGEMILHVLLMTEGGQAA